MIITSLAKQDLVCTLTDAQSMVIGHTGVLGQVVLAQVKENEIETE